MKRESIFILVLLFITAIPVYPADINDDDFGRDDYLERKYEKAKSREGFKYVTMFGAVPYIRTVYLEPGNEFYPNNAGIAFHVAITQSKHNDLPFPVNLSVDFGFIGTGIEVLQSDGSWWGAAGDKMNGLWADITVEGGLKINEFIRPNVFVGYSYSHYINNADITKKITGDGLCGGIGINFYISKEHSVFYRMQFNTINFRHALAGIETGSFMGSSISHHIGARYCIYLDPYKSYLDRRKNEKKKREYEKQKEPDPIDKPEFSR